MSSPIFFAHQGLTNYEVLIDPLFSDCHAATATFYQLLVVTIYEHSLSISSKYFSHFLIWYVMVDV